MPTNPSNQPIATMVAAGFVEAQFTAVQKRFLAAELPFQVLSPDGGLIQGWHDGSWGHHFMADDKLADVLSADFQALIVPGGERAIAALSANPHAGRLVKAFLDAGKPVCLVGGAVSLLSVADAAAGKRIAATGPEAEALGAAGATIVEEGVVVDGALISARDDANFAEVLDGMVGALTKADDPVDEAA